MLLLLLETIMLPVLWCQISGSSGLGRFGISSSVIMSHMFSAVNIIVDTPTPGDGTLAESVIYYHKDQDIGCSLRGTTFLNSYNMIGRW